MPDISGDSVRGHLNTMILSVLEAGPAHGFEILKRFEAEGNGHLKLKEGSVYPALYRLESAGLVKATWEATTVKRRGPRRRIYQLTRKGRGRLAEGRRQWTAFVGIVGPIIGAPA